jgi:predicted unusual protein kinase regulating ubiquinone biosynthesis (AarF/ABC1/UbiB family)
MQQVLIIHVKMKDGKKLAVKIQYPGVANSISSDLSDG